MERAWQVEMFWTWRPVIDPQAEALTAPDRTLKWVMNDGERASGPGAGSLYRAHFLVDSTSLRPSFEDVHSLGSETSNVWGMARIP